MIKSLSVKLWAWLIPDCNCNQFDQITIHVPSYKFWEFKKETFDVPKVIPQDAKEEINFVYWICKFCDMFAPLYILLQIIRLAKQLPQGKVMSQEVPITDLT